MYYYATNMKKGEKHWKKLFKEMDKLNLLQKCHVKILKTKKI